MLFIPRQVLLELESVGQASVAVDPFFAHRLFFRSARALEDIDGKPPWAECVYVWLVSTVAVVLWYAGFNLALSDEGWPGAALLLALPATFYIFRQRIMVRLGSTVLVLLGLALASLLAQQPAWVSCSLGALFAFFFSYWYATAMVRNLVIRSDRAYSSLYRGLLIEIRADANPLDDDRDHIELPRVMVHQTDAS